MSETTTPEVRDNRAAHRFETVVDGELSQIAYFLRPGVIVFTHTEVPEALEGRGIASLMVRVALEQARAEGLRVVPRCPFVAAYIRRHPQYQDLVRETTEGRA